MDPSTIIGLPVGFLERFGKIVAIRPQTIATMDATLHASTAGGLAARRDRRRAGGGRDLMKRPATPRRRPVVQITLGRASRLHRLVRMLAAGPTVRDELLDRLAIGLRTFYRELDLLKRCGIKVKREGKQYHLGATVAEAEGRLPFPDPQLSFAEMAELAAHPGPASRRLAEILRGVIDAPKPAPAKRRRKKADD
jgi:hypothetical protein